MKSIIIGGVPRAGKSTLAKMLQKKLGFSRIPTDPLICAFEKTYPELDIKHADNILKTGKHFTPFMNTFFENIVRQTGPFVIEGCHFHPSYFSDTVKEHFTIIFVGYCDITPEEKHAHTRRIDRENQGRTNRLTDDELHTSLSEWKETSQEMKQVCKEEGFIFVDTGDDYKGALEKIFVKINE